MQIMLLHRYMVYTSTRCLTHDVVHYQHHFEHLVLHNIDSSTACWPTTLFEPKVRCSLIDQTTPSAALDVLHHQHAEGGSGHSGRAFVTQMNAYNWEMHTQLVVGSPMFADSAQILLQTGLLTTL